MERVSRKMQNQPYEALGRWVMHILLDISTWHAIETEQDNILSLISR